MIFRRTRGLTVIETLIAATLFLTAIVTLVGLYPAAARATRQAQGHLMATNLAEKELELSRATNFDALVDRTNTYALETTNNGAPDTLTFQAEVKIRDVRPGLRGITVTVTWQGSDRFNRSLKMETYAAKLSP